MMDYQIEICQNLLCHFVPMLSIFLLISFFEYTEWLKRQWELNSSLWLSYPQKRLTLFSVCFLELQFTSSWGGVVEICTFYLLPSTFITTSLKKCLRTILSGCNFLLKSANFNKFFKMRIFQQSKSCSIVGL